MFCRIAQTISIKAMSFGLFPRIYVRCVNELVFDFVAFADVTGEKNSMCSIQGDSTHGATSVGCFKTEHKSIRDVSVLCDIITQYVCDNKIVVVPYLSFDNFNTKRSYDSGLLIANCFSNIVVRELALRDSRMICAINMLHISVLRIELTCTEWLSHRYPTKGWGTDKYCDSVNMDFVNLCSASTLFVVFDSRDYYVCTTCMSNIANHNNTNIMEIQVCLHGYSVYQASEQTNLNKNNALTLKKICAKKLNS